MDFALDLLPEAVLFGLLLGCFYAAVSVGLSVSFGLLDVPHIAHPAFMVLGSYCTWLLGVRFGLDPILAGIVLMPAFFLFGVAFIVEVGLILVFGVVQRMVEAAYIGKSLEFGEMRIPLRMIVAFVTALVLT